MQKVHCGEGAAEVDGRGWGELDWNAAHCWRGGMRKRVESIARWLVSVSAGRREKVNEGIGRDCYPQQPPPYGLLASHFT